MTTPRHRIVDSTQPMYYHLDSRCVRRAWLSGKHGRKDYSYRKVWLEERLKELAPCFTLEVYAHAIMSNHFHLVVYYNPLAANGWSAEEVVDRWLTVSPPKDLNGAIDEGMRELRKSVLLQQTDEIERLRNNLSSLSVFMKFLKQPIARRANLDDNCQGHLFEKRFYSGALLDEDALLTAMAYVDLNPIRANIVETLEACENTSLADRIHSGEFSLTLHPTLSGLAPREPVLQMNLLGYILHLRAIIHTDDQNRLANDEMNRWQQNVSLIKRKQRAFGSAHRLTEWISARGLQLRELPLL